MLDINFKLTDEQKDWFAERMDENASGRVLVPSYLYTKFRKLAENEFISNSDIKNYLIECCYNN
jgi:hypothetical protein